MKRHGKSLTKKSRTHQVYATSKDSFQVVSGSSGSQYTIRTLSDGRFWCSCDWHKWHPAGECSHVLSVRQWLAQAGNRSIRGYGEIEEVRKSHHKLEFRNDGLFVVSRA